MTKTKTKSPTPDIPATRVLPMSKTHIWRFLRPFLKSQPNNLRDLAKETQAFYLVKEFTRNYQTEKLDEVIGFYHKVPKRIKTYEKDRPLNYDSNGFLDWKKFASAKHYFTLGVAYKISAKKVLRLIETECKEALWK